MLSPRPRFSAAISALVNAAMNACMVHRVCRVVPQAITSRVLMRALPAVRSEAAKASARLRTQLQKTCILRMCRDFSLGSMRAYAA